MFKSIMVLEVPWDRNAVDSISVWPFVSEFARACKTRAYYRTFSDSPSFRHWVERFDKERLPGGKGGKLLYVAAHGDKGRIAGLRKRINCRTIVNSCAAAKSIGFVHFGSCFFGNEQNLDLLLKSAKKLVWVAGYEKDVDWVDSTLFDLMLWGRIKMRDSASKGKQFQTIAEEFCEELEGLAVNLGFRFHYRRGKDICAIFN